MYWLRNNIEKLQRKNVISLFKDKLGYLEDKNVLDC